MREGLILPVVYVTQYALATGILRFQNVRRCDSVSSKMIDCDKQQLFHKPHWYETLEEAEVQVEKMRQAKIKSLQKTLAKMLNFKTKVIEK